MTKKPHKLRGGHIQRLAAATPKQHVTGLGLIGVPGLRNAAAMAAQAEMDAARAALWAHHYGLNLQNLRRLTLAEIAHHISHNTAWGAIEIPSYVLATIAAMQPTEPPATPMQRKGSNPVPGWGLPDELTKITPNPHAGYRYQDGKPVDPLREPPHEVRSCGCQVNAPHLCGKRGT